MKRIHLTITAESALALGQRKPGGSVSEAMNYIPGGAIRGAIAAQLLNQAGEPEIDAEGNGDDFHKLFLNDQAAVFQNAYPAIAKFKDVLGDDHYEESPDVRLLPLTALSSKNDSGFKPRFKSSKNGVFDSLIDGFCAREHGHFYEPNDLAGERVEPFSGFYSRQANNAEETVNPQYFYYSHPTTKRLLTRVGINRRRATAQEEILYSIEVLDEVPSKKQDQRMVYRSSILLQDEELAEQFCQFINSNSNQFRLGGSTSRGLGKVKLEAKIEVSETQCNPVETRIKAFNTAIKERWELWSVFGGAKLIGKRIFFTVNLQSDAILTEEWRRTIVISEPMLRQAVGMPEADDPSLKLQAAYGSSDYRSGWNAAWGLQKDLELVTKMGGVYLFSTEKPDSWYEKLTALEFLGVGDRTSEGFGQIQVCDDFHLIFREHAV